MPWPRRQEIAIYLKKKKELGEKGAKAYMKKHGAFKKGK
jgi:hypothetical protein